jgi:hypothetical protein
MIPAQRKVWPLFSCTASQAGRNGEGNGTCRAAFATRFAAYLAEHLTHIWYMKLRSRLRQRGRAHRYIVDRGG